MQQANDLKLNKTSHKQASNGTSVTPTHVDVTFSTPSSWSKLGDMAVKTLHEAIAYYKTVARAELKSEKTIEWTSRSAERFADFLGGDPALSKVNANDLRRFISAFITPIDLCQGFLSARSLGLFPLKAIEDAHDLPLTLRQMEYRQKHLSLNMLKFNFFVMQDKS